MQSFRPKGTNLSEPRLKNNQAGFNLRAPDFPVPVRFGFALLAVILATLLHNSLSGMLGGAVPFILYYPTVVLAGWFGGLWPGLFTVALSGLVAGYAFMLPYDSFVLR